MAIVGKYAGTYVAARFCGIEKREASALGWLMNTRGLTELIVLNIGLSLHVISPLLFTMLVIMALVTTFMTSPLLERTYPKRLIRGDVVQPVQTEPEPAYRILVPIANPSTQKGLIQLAAAIAVGNSFHSHDFSAPAAVYPLSLIQLNEDYAFESTPAEADRRIADRRMQVHELIETLDPPDLRARLYPIVGVTTDVAKETARVAEQDGVDLILVGWHRPAFSKNRLGGRVGQILSTAKTDVAVFIDRQHSKLEKLLVPYISNTHNDLGLEIALRLLINQKDCLLTILCITQESQGNDFTYEFRTLLSRLPDSVRKRIHISQLEAENPIDAVVEASGTVDLTIAGASREWGLERQTLGFYTDELAVQCRSSLLIARRYNRVTAHLSSVLESNDSGSRTVSNEPEG